MPNLAPLRPLLDPVPADLAAWFDGLDGTGPPLEAFEHAPLDPAAAAARTLETRAGVGGYGEPEAARELGLIALTDGLSDRYLYCPGAPYPGAVAFHDGHGDPDHWAAPSLAAFADLLRTADAAGGEDDDDPPELREFHRPPPAPGPDQPAIDARIAALLDRFAAGGQELETPLILLAAASAFQNRPLWERMVREGGWYMLEAVADAIARRPSPGVRWLAEALAGYGHTNVSVPGARALAACDAAEAA